MPDELELKPIQKKIGELVLDTPAPGKHASRSAIAHIQKAWRLRAADPEMAAFRAITGEEESATAIFHAVRRRRYVGAEKLNPRMHPHKWAVTPFFQAVAQALSEVQHVLKPTLEISKVDGVERVRVSVDIEQAGVAGRAYPLPPLNFNMLINGKQHDYSAELESIAKGKRFGTIKKYIDDLANQRNRILYASAQGIPSIEHPLDKRLLRRRDNIFRNLTVYLLVDPYPEKQLFVSQCLSAFLSMLNLLPKDGGSGSQ